MEKDALLERLVRLGATDVPNTPRLLMKHRSPQELAQLQHGVDGAFNKVQGPMRAKLDSVTSGLTGRLQSGVRGAGHLAINHPEILPMQALPVPGLTPAYLGLKKGLEHLIDRTAPAAKLESMKMAASAPTRGGFMMASDIPAFRAPQLQRGIQKAGDLEGAPPAKGKEKDSDMNDSYMPYSPGDFKKSKYAMSVGALAEFVELLRKEANMLGSPAGHLASTQRIGAPKASAPAGPSIADIAKPKGAKFGIGIPGAFKTKI